LYTASASNLLILLNIISNIASNSNNSKIQITNLVAASTPAVIRLPQTTHHVIQLYCQQHQAQPNCFLSPLTITDGGKKLKERTR